MDFATSRKHKRQQFRVVDLIASWDVEEKVRANDTRGKELLGLQVLIWCRRTTQMSTVAKKNKNKKEDMSKTKQTTTFKKKKSKGRCYNWGLFATALGMARNTSYTHAFFP
jgi:hypothetical protein